MKKLFLVLLLVFFVFFYLTYQLTPIIEQLANYQIKRFCQLVVNGTATMYEVDDILTRQEDNVGVDMTKASAIASKIVTDMEETFFLIEEGLYKESDTIYQTRLKEINDSHGVVASIPLGSIFHNAFFHNIGPSIDVRYVTMSYLTSEVEKEVESYGINHTMVVINLNVTIHLQVATLFYQEEVVKNIEYPLLLEIIQGEIPQWYQN